MKWKGRQGSGNIEDRRGMSSGRIVAGGGIGTIIILLIVLLLGGDPVKLLDSFQQGNPTTQTEQVSSSAEEEEMEQFVSVVLKDTETVWGKIFEQSGSSYRQPKLVLFRDQVESACGFASAASGPFYCPEDEKVYIDLAFCDQLNTLDAGDVDEAANAASSIGDDNLQMKYQGRVIPDAFTHGTSAQMKEWFLKGWETGNLDNGDTFSAAL